MVMDRAAEEPTQESLNHFSQPLGGCPHMDWVVQFLHEEDGQDVVEYGLLIATIAIVVLVGVGFSEATSTSGS